MTHGDDDSLRDNPLADQLRELDISPSEKAPKSAPSSHPGNDESQQFSDDELFERAMADLDAEDIPDPDEWNDEPRPSLADARHTPRPSSSASSKRPQNGDETNQSSSTATDCAEKQGSKDEPLSEREYFEQAVETIDPSRLYAAKFKGEAATDLPEQPSPKIDATTDSSRTEGATSSQKSGTKVDEAKTRLENQHLQERRRFEAMMADVTPLDDGGKYHQRQPRRRRPDRDSTSASVGLCTPRLPKDGEGLHYVPPLDASQRRLLGRLREESGAPPTLHIRGDRRDEALDRLSDFVDHHRAQETPFVRIVHGRGLRSQNEPVLKPAVLRWLEGPGLASVAGYVPERTQSGDYGSLVVELRALTD